MLSERSLQKLSMAQLISDIYKPHMWYVTLDSTPEHKMYSYTRKPTKLYCQYVQII